MGNPVVHFEVVGQDGEKLQAFYRDLFDWKLNVMPEMAYGLVEKEDGGIGGGIGKAQDGPGYVTFYVQVDDPQAYLDKAESLGGKTIVPVTEIPDMVTFALFADPEGHMVGVVKSEG
jgi:predicted enzyme related to lactoylglutathione lyase